MIYISGTLSDPDTEGDSSATQDPYADDPKRNPAFVVNSEKPYNGEPPLPLLVEHFITPTYENTFFYMKFLLHELGCFRVRFLKARIFLFETSLRNLCRKLLSVGFPKNYYFLECWCRSGNH